MSIFQKDFPLIPQCQMKIHWMCDFQLYIHHQQ